MVGRQLLNPRIGSIAEDEAAALIRRIAFLNRPLTPDDVGADFVGAVARAQDITRETRTSPMLYSGRWFLLSVKSGSAQIGLRRSAGHFDWFLNLEIPLLLAHVDSSDQIRVRVYHTLQHISAIKQLPETVESVEFRTEVSPNYRPRNFRMDRSDVIEVDGESAIAWLGPPLLDLTRPQLLDREFAGVTSSLLQTVCDTHPGVQRRGIAGMTTGIMWETNSSLDVPVRQISLVPLAKTTEDPLTEIEQALESHAGINDLMAAVFEHSRPLFRLFSILRTRTGQINISAEDLFGDARTPSPNGDDHSTNGG